MKLATIGKPALTIIANQCRPLSLITQECKSINQYQPWLIKTNICIHIYIISYTIPLSCTSSVTFSTQVRVFFFLFLFQGGKDSVIKQEIPDLLLWQEDRCAAFYHGFWFQSSAPSLPRSLPSKKVHSTWSLLNTFFFVKWEGIRIYGVKV